MSNGNNYQWNRNSRTRTDLSGKTTPTILFRTLFPDFKTFELMLTPFGYVADQIKEKEFLRLQMMISNSYLRYKTENKNYAFISMKIDELIGLRERENKIYALEPSALLENLSTQEQKFFTVNRTNLDVVSDDFLDNSTSSKITNQAPYITQMQELLKNTQMVNPDLTFLYRLATSLLYPLQHNIINEQFGRKDK